MQNGAFRTAAHSGAQVGAAAMLAHDPSSPLFCSLLTGAAVSSRAPPAFATCLALEEAGVVQLEDCAANFCSTGIAGLQDFMRNLLAWLRDQAVWLVLGVAVLILLQLTSLVMSFLLLFHGQKPETADGQPSDRTGLLPGGGGGGGEVGDGSSADLSERIDVRTVSVHESVGGGGAAAAEDPAAAQAERAKFRRKIQDQLASLERP